MSTARKFLTAIDATDIALQPSAYTTGTLSRGLVRNVQGLEIALTFTANQPPAGTTIRTGVATDVTANTFTKTSHGFTDTTQVVVTGLSNTTGLLNGRTYFVRDATANTFKLALTSGGTAIDLTGTADASVTVTNLDQSSTSPEFGQGTPLLIKYYPTLNFVGPTLVGPGIETNAATGVGKRGIIQIEGQVVYNFNDGLAGTPLAVQAMMQHRNSPSVAINMQPSHSCLMQPWYVADGATVTLTQPGDGSADGGVAFYDNTIYTTVNGGHLDGTTQSVAPASFRSGVHVTGNSDLAEYRTFECGVPNIDTAGGASIGTITGLYIPLLGGASTSKSVGIRNESAYVAPYQTAQAVTAASAQIDAGEEHVAVTVTGNITLTSTPSITAPYEKGHRVRITNTDTTDTLTLSDASVLAGSNLTLPTDSFALRPGQTCEFVAATDSGPWVLANASDVVPSAYLNRIYKIPVRGATIAALPACTYANGTAGVGATLTGNANGALTAQDGVTFVAADRVMVNTQASTFQNGIYVVTQVGTGGTPFILTRSTSFDEAAEMTAGVGVFVTEGTAYAGTDWYLATTVATVGTDAVTFRGKRAGTSGFAGFSNFGLPAWGLGPDATTAPDVKFTRTGTGTASFVGTVTIPAPVITGHPTIEGVVPAGATGTGNLVFASTPTLTTPVIGAATGTSLAVTGLIKSSGTAGIGYATGAGGTVTQATSKVTGVTLNKITGQITMFSAGQTAGQNQAFVLTNSTIAADDVVVVSHNSGGTTGAYLGWASNMAAGSCTIVVRNMTGSTLTEAPVISFAVIKGVAS